jgi:hypothetical protein
MRQICPHCQQLVTIPDTEAGKTAPCPECQQPFAIPAHYAAQVLDAPASASQPVSPPPPSTTNAAEPPPPNGPSASAPSLAEPPAPQLPTAPQGYTKLCSIPLNRAVCHWLGPVCLTILFFLTFFNWVGAYPAGYASYTQNGWQALGADLSVDPVSEKELKMESSLNHWLRSSWWLLPYMILLIVGVFVAWSELISNYIRRKFPPIVEAMIRRRPALLAVCAGMTLFFLLLQYAAGFGVERALNNLVQSNFQETRQNAKTPEENQKVDIQMATIAGGYQMRTTIWLKLAMALHFLALAAIIGETLLIHRGDKPPPRIGAMW